jgi:hypothetical protein
MGGVIWLRQRVFEESGIGMQRKKNLKGVEISTTQLSNN